MTVAVEAASRAEALVGHSVQARLPCHRLVDRDGGTDLRFEHLHYGDRVELRICLPAQELQRPPSVLEARSALWLGPGHPAALFS